MFDVGFWEVTMIGIVALVIVGPERLPGLARTVGLWVGKGRRMIADVKRDIDREIKASDMEGLSSVKTELEKVRADVGSKAKDFVKDSGIEDTQSSLKQAMEEASPLKDEIGENIDELDQVAKEVEQELGQAEAAATDKSLNPEPGTASKKKAAKKKATKKKTGKKVTKKAASKKTPAKKAATEKLPAEEPAAPPPAEDLVVSASSTDVEPMSAQNANSGNSESKPVVDNA